MNSASLDWRRMLTASRRRQFQFQQTSFWMPQRNIVAWFLQQLHSPHSGNGGMPDEKGRVLKQAPRLSLDMVAWKLTVTVIVSVWQLGIESTHCNWSIFAFPQRKWKKKENGTQCQFPFWIWPTWSRRHMFFAGRKGTTAFLYSRSVWHCDSPWDLWVHPSWSYGLFLQPSPPPPAVRLLGVLSAFRTSADLWGLDLPL